MSCVTIFSVLRDTENSLREREMERRRGYGESRELSKERGGRMDSTVTTKGGNIKFQVSSGFVAG